MARLLQALACWCVLLHVAHAGGSADYCSLIVKVVSPGGVEENGAVVQVSERNGRIIKEHYEPGGLRVCDLGILPITVTVGPEGSCSQVVVRNVTLNWGKTFELKVTYDPQPCQDTPAPLPQPICEILFRAADDTGAWVRNPRMEFNSPKRSNIIGDQFGRLRVVTNIGTEVSGSISAPGYAAEEVSMACLMATPPKTEQRVTLKRK